MFFLIVVVVISYIWNCKITIFC